MLAFQKVSVLRVKCILNFSTFNFARQQVKSFEEVPQVRRKNFIQRIRKTINKLVSKEQIDVNYERDDYFSVMYKRYGKIVRDPKTKVVHLFDPKDVEILFKNESRLPTKMMLDAVNVARDRNKDTSPKFSLFFNNGDDWYNLRSKMSNFLFKPQTSQNLCPLFDSIALDFANNISAIKNKENDHIEHLFHELCKWSFENTGLLVFGKRLGSLNLDQRETGSDSIRFVTALDDLFTASYKLELGFPWYKWFSTPKYKIVEQNYATLTQIALKYVKQNINEILNKGETEHQSSLLKTLVSQKKVNDEEIVSIVTDLLTGGTDTTSAFTAMALYHLAKHPNEQQKLYEAIQQCFPHPNEVITIGHLQPMSYLKACINETHRLTPIIDVTSRILHKDHVFSDYNVPSGTKVVVHHRLMGKIYFADSNKFKPERWLNDNDKPHSFSWLPFGHGARGCVGQNAAQLEMLLVIIRIIQRYKLSYDGEGRVTTTSTFLNKPSEDLRIKFIER